MKQGIRVKLASKRYYESIQIGKVQEIIIQTTSEDMHRISEIEPCCWNRRELEGSRSLAKPARKSDFRGQLTDQTHLKSTKLSLLLVMESHRNCRQRQS